MLFILPLFLFGAAAAAETSPSRTNSDVTYAPGDLIFQEEFDTLDLAVWNHEVNMNGGGNNEFQIYDKYDENAYVRDGILYMKPTLSIDTIFDGNHETLYNGHLRLEGCTDDNGGEACEKQGSYPNILPPAVSARLRTAGSFSFTYGKVEVRAKMSSGDWMWPAIWMLPEEWKYGVWPASGEIDLLESRGNRQLFNPSGINIGSEQAGSTLHYGPFWPHNGWWAAHGEKQTPFGEGYDRDFHLFELEWTPEMIKFSIDGTEVKTIAPGSGGFWELGQFPADITNPWQDAENPVMAPFDQKFHFILNVAVGGNFFPAGTTPARPWNGETNYLDFFLAKDQWESTWQGEEAAMAVDYIRVYAI